MTLRACIMHKCMNLCAFVTIYGLNVINFVQNYLFLLNLVCFCSPINAKVHYLHTCITKCACVNACIIQKQTICIMALWGVIFESEGILRQCIYHFIKQKALMHNACMMIMHKCMHLLGIYLLICT